MGRGARWTVPTARGPACWSPCLVEASPRLPPPQVRAFLQPPMKGVVMETFGSGNGPTKPDLLQELRAAAERGLVIINCTHCLQGAVTSDYGAGVVGVVGGVPGAGAGASPGRQPPSRSTCAPLPPGLEWCRDSAGLRHDVRGGTGQAVLRAGPARAEPGRQEGGACASAPLGSRVVGGPSLGGCVPGLCGEARSGPHDPSPSPSPTPPHNPTLSWGAPHPTLSQGAPGPPCSQGIPTLVLPRLAPCAGQRPPGPRETLSWRLEGGLSCCGDLAGSGSGPQDGT